MLFHKTVQLSRLGKAAYRKRGQGKHTLNLHHNRRKTSMDEAKKVIWAGIDVGKRSFVADLDD